MRGATILDQSPRGSDARSFGALTELAPWGNVGERADLHDQAELACAAAPARGRGRVVALAWEGEQPADTGNQGDHQQNERRVI